IALSAAAAGSLSFLQSRQLMRPSRRMLRWSLVRLFRSGRWFAAASLTYWISSIGLIPLCGILIGLEASGSLRIILLAFAPLSQFCTAMVSVRLPQIARELRAGERAAMRSAARVNALLLGGV